MLIKILTELWSEKFEWFGPSPIEPSNSGINHAELLRIPTSTLIQLAKRAALVTGGALVGIGLSGEVDRKKCSARFFLKFQESLLEEILQSSPTVGIIVNTIDVHSFWKSRKMLMKFHQNNLAQGNCRQIDEILLIFYIGAVCLLFSTSLRPRCLGAVCWFLFRGYVCRPDDACRKRFSWFSDWSQTVQKFVNLVDFVKSIQTR